MARTSSSFSPQLQVLLDRSSTTVIHDYVGQETFHWDLLNCGDWYSYSLLTTSIATSTNDR